MESKGKIKLKRKLKATNSNKKSPTNSNDTNHNKTTYPVSTHTPQHIDTVHNNIEPRIYKDLAPILQNCKSETSIDEKINCLCDLMQAQFQQIQEKMIALETKIGEINTQSNAFAMGGLGNNTSKRAESKEAYLNENVKNVVNQPIYAYISDKCKAHITNQHVYDILNKVQDIYSVAASVIQDIQEKNGVQILYSFAFQKNAHTLYHWVNDKQTWEKMNQKQLQLLFDAVQKEIISQYNNILLNQDENEDFDVENSVYIFKDDFDKKHRSFRKLIYEKIM